MSIRWKRTVAVCIGLLFATLPGAAAINLFGPALPAPSPGLPVGPSTPTLPGSAGYWQVTTDGGVFTFGSAAFAGSTGSIHLAAPIVAMLPTPTGRGYWLAASDGGVFSFGDAPFVGNAVGGPPGSKPIVAIAGTPTGRGYWLFSASGFVFTLGDATYFGSPPAVHAPIVAAAASPTGQGYYIAAADGSVYPEGDAYALGDASQARLTQPVTAIATTPDGYGYWLVTSGGQVLSYGDALFGGNAAATAPIVGITASTGGRGYWLSAADGGAFGFGDAAYLGSASQYHPSHPVVATRTRSASHGTGLVTFYYPWYGSPATGQGYRHWDEGGHVPPDDIGSDYYPLRGAYSSLDPAVLDSQMAEIADHGIGEVVVSWWGQGSYEDTTLTPIIAAAARHRVTVAIHLEPYAGRSPASVTSDYAYLKGIGITDIWVYMADQFAPPMWSALNDAYPTIRTMAESGHVTFVKGGGFAPWAAASHFRGIYLYDAINYEGRDDAAFCGLARAFNLVCAPVAAPGFIAVRATAATYGKSRHDGATYDRRWMGVLGSRPDLVAITSYNEWHEGSQIEPAVTKCLGAAFCYRSYEGAFGTTGRTASYSYLDRTRTWAQALQATNP